ncbi:hypothetical protein AC578_3003 [Pseudocercospora eumusae]|uniref:AB hydrolase-1 domain-containing protein n=1 Tax=Pseudocercospora eumusae TaxID=321146 RepID=A0A139H1S0_9PEZI|nr:hypothetical protein AC578_3003 [Pseudocercospora eumusae]
MAITLALLALASSSLAVPTEGLQCREVTFVVSASAQNRNISNVDFTNLDALTAALQANNFQRFDVSGKQQIAGWYCEPTLRSLSVDKLQILLGSITTNREVWTAQGGTALCSPNSQAYKPEIYSWTRYANELGVALYHALVEQIKSGPLSGSSPLPRTFQHLAFVGLSYGSVIGNLIAQAHPEDFEELILTGFSKSVLPSLPGVAAQGAKPAKDVDPERFGNLPAGYLASPVEQTRTNSFFGDPAIVDFEPENAHLFFTRKDVVSTGQFVSTYVDIVEAPMYRGRVLVLTGEQDQAFCGPGSSAINPQPSCGGLLAETGSLFPNAKYSWKSIPRSGHALILHKSARKTLQVAHDFLAGKSFEY